MSESLHKSIIPKEGLNLVSYTTLLQLIWFQKYARTVCQSRKHRLNNSPSEHKRADFENFRGFTTQ
ncbi:MAG TPA: hypothetical protein DD473_13995 [Planctomycetaceae bacterium]|nr:hypothetical protein [Planctomycetaceae bacterium]